jgi:TrmH family RNA methyltransferase
MDPPPVSRKSPSEGAEELLSRIHVVLVEPTGPLNVGSAARAMANFGLSRLRIIKGPPTDHPQCRAMATHAQDVLAEARRCSTLEEALSGATFIVGTTARGRHRVQALPPRETARRIVEEARRGEVAILFGREDHGLSKEELRRAHVVTAVETAPRCRALNLAQAVLLISYEIFAATGARGQIVTSDEGPLLREEQRVRLRELFIEALGCVGIVHSGTEVAMRQSVERLLALGPMQSRDARTLFGLTREVVRRLGSERERPATPSGED